MKRHCNISVIAIAAAVLLAAGSLSGLAAQVSSEEYRVISDKVIISLGSYLTDFKTDASVGSGGVFGTSIRAEDELGIDDDDSAFRLEAMYRFNSRHSINLGFWTLNREGQAIINEQITFDGDTFDIGAALESQFDTQWIRIDYRYSFLRTNRGEAGISAGLSVYQFDFGVEGLATVSDGMGGFILEQTNSADDLLAPVPTMGFFITYAIRPTLVFRLKAEFFDLEVDDFEGSLTDTNMMLEWYFSEHVGIGGGFNGTDLDFRSVGDDPFTVDYSQSGLVGYFTIAFGGMD